MKMPRWALGAFSRFTQGSPLAGETTGPSLGTCQCACRVIKCLLVSARVPFSPGFIVVCVAFARGLFLSLNSFRRRGTKDNKTKNARHQPTPRRPLAPSSFFSPISRSDPQDSRRATARTAAD